MMIPQIKKILYASDLSDNSIPALAWAMMLADRHDARITFLHVIEEAPPSSVYMVQSFIGDKKWKEMTDSQHDEVNASVKDRVNLFCEKVKNDMEACPFVVSEIIVDRGLPVDRILHEAESRKCDLIIMGTHGHGLFKDAMIGSTARRVLRRSNKPVFVIPLAEDDR